MFLSLFIVSVFAANASTIDCVNSSADIKTCLQEEAQNALADQQIHFENQLGQIVLDQKLNGFEVQNTQSLASTFQIEVPESKDTWSTPPSPCFDWSDSIYNRASGLGRERVYGIVANQMKEVAVFLRHYHVFSLGKESSYLYQIRRVEICQGDDEIKFDKNVLKIGLSLDYALINEPYFTGKEIFDLWNDGTIVFGKPLNMITKIRAGMKKDVEALLRDRLRASWIVLNPIGSIRQTLRIAITQGVLSEIKKIVQSLANPNDLAVRVLGEHGLSDSRVDYADVVQQWKANLEDNALINQITEQALFARNIGTMRLQNNDHRKQVALFALKNNKQINVDLSGLFASSYTNEELLGNEEPVSEVTLNSDSWQVAGIAIDLIDQVNVNVAVPSNLVETIKKLSLKKALE